MTRERTKSGVNVFDKGDEPSEKGVTKCTDRERKRNLVSNFSGKITREENW